MKSILALSLVAAASAAMADATYSSYPSTSSDAWVVGYYEPFFQFSPTSSGDLNGLEVAIGDWLSSGDQGFELYLYDSSNGDQQLGNLIGSWHGETTGQDYTDSNIVVATPDEPYLVAGQEYWLGAVADNNDYGTLAWAMSVSVSGNMIEQGTIGYYGVQQQAAFATPAQASATPGPAALLPFATGLIALLKRNKRA
jgi:hypothetical protein